MAVNAPQRHTSPNFAAAFLAFLIVGGCDGPGTPEPPVSVSLVAPSPTDILEAEDLTIRVSVSLDTVPSTSLLVPLEYSGSATRDYDYAVSADLIIVPARAATASVDIDIFRDFDAEDDETIIVSLGEIEGNGMAGATTRIELTIVDGGAANADKTHRDEGSDFLILPTRLVITEESFDFAAAAINASFEGGAPGQLIAEWSSDRGFNSDVNLLGIFDIPAIVPEMQLFPVPHEFSLPYTRLVPNETYFVRMYVNDGQEAPSMGQLIRAGALFLFSFATNSDGRIVTRCEAPVRVPSTAATDPLFSEQWHLQNSGQSAFAAYPGVAGADLQMAESISKGYGGDGVKLAVVDTGLEICHPDLAANVEPGKSFNFRSGKIAGSLPTDPFNYDILGDHGTSVAGVAAAVANNGLGGRGVSPDVELRAYNIGAVFAVDSELQLLNSLGASSSDPDSASADIFNMSFGTVAPSQNPTDDFVRLFEMGTSELRSGLGALYIRAAGNAFGFCDHRHPLNLEIGCIGSNADPDQNLPYLVTVGAFNASDVKSSYSSAGANLWVVGPGGEDGVEHPAMITTDQIGVEAGFSQLPENSLTGGHPLNTDGDYISAFGGTSSAAPATAGAVAVLLGVNPNLTWRDVKHILAASARRIDPEIEAVRAAFNGTPVVLQHAWQTNAAGYPFHNWYGFGAVSLDNAVAMAETYPPDSLGEFVSSPWFQAADIGNMPLDVPDNDGAGVTHALEVTGLPQTANIEAVVLEIAVRHSYAADLGVQLTSPGGTQSILNTPFNAILEGWPGLHDWQLMSNAFYGENANGIWTVQVVDLAEEDTGSLSSWRLRFYYGDHP